MDPVTACTFALSHWPLAPAVGEQVPDEGCLVYQADFAGRFSHMTTEEDAVDRFELVRSRFETGAQAGRHASMRIAVDTARHVSLPDMAAMGIRPQIVEARLHLPEAGLTAVAGAIDNIWTLSGNGAFGWRPLVNNLGQGYGLLDRSDVGAGLIWTAPERFATVDMRLVEGDGLHVPDTNAGKTGQVMVTVRPVALGEELPANTIEISGYLQRGTRGDVDTSDHRIGARLSGRYKGQGLGMELLTAEGVQGFDASPWGLATWATTRPWGPLAGVARYERVAYDSGPESAATERWVVAAGAEVPGGAARGAHLMAGIDQSDLRSGSESLDRSTAVFVQLGGLFLGAAPLLWAGTPR